MFTFRQVALATLFTVGLAADAALGQTISRQWSGVETMFGSQSNAFTASDPIGIFWAGPPIGPYPVGAVIPTLPAPPAPTISPTGGNPFAGLLYSWFASDNLGTNSTTYAQPFLDDNIAATPTVTSDISIAIPSWRFVQEPNAPGYAYEQMNFGSNYLFTSNPGLGPSAPALPLFISGAVVPGPNAYLQFDAVIDYTWLPVNVNSAGVISPAGPPALLGTLSYSFSQPTGGAFGATVFSTGSLLGVPSGDGILALTGHAWIAGDPFDVTVSTVPEPGALTLLAAAALGAGGIAARRRFNR